MSEEKLLDILVCPIGLARLSHKDERLTCTRCGTQFAIVDDIPNMLIDEATLPEGCNDFSELDCIKSGDVKISLT